LLQGIAISVKINISKIKAFEESNMLHAISTSDWHLGGLRKVFPHDHIQRQITEIDKIYRYAIEHDIQHVFVPGDISNDPTLDDPTLIALLSLLLTYDGSINTYYIAGNHDFESKKKTSLDVLRLLIENGAFKTFHLFLSAESRKIDGVPVNFLPFPSDNFEQRRAALNFVHVDFDGAVSDSGYKAKVAHEMYVPEHSFTISGHIHKYQYLKKKRVVYNGNPYQVKFDERLPKGFVEFWCKFKNGQIQMRHQFINNNPEFRLEQVTINSAHEIESLSDSPHVKYSIAVGDGVILPSNISTIKPSIVAMRGFKNIAEANAELERKIIAASNYNASGALTDGLPAYLKAAGLKKSNVKQGMTMVLDAIKQLRLN
jgi:predicted phosphodiesterase